MFTTVQPLPVRGARAMALLLPLLAILAALVAPTRAAELTQIEIDNRRCLNCHGQSSIAERGPAERRAMVAPAATVPATEPAVRPALYTPGDTLKASVHAGVACVSCHAQAKSLPHEGKLGPPTCDTTGCHQKESAAYRASSHAMAAAKGEAKAPNCSTCHGGHDILKKQNPNAHTYPLNVVKICGDCHENFVTKSANGGNGKHQVTDYLESVHGRIIAGGNARSATCASCHGPHDIRPSKDPQSKVHRANVAATCADTTCHVGSAQDYAKSIHGTLVAAGDAKAPTCSDCHTSHAINRVESPAFMQDIVGQCGTCHDKPAPGSREKASLYQTYRASYHGQFSRLGGDRVALCSSCHGSHDIQKIDHPASRLNAKNKVNTCRQSKCHPGAGENLASFAPHADFRNSDRYPILHYIYLYFVIMMSGAFGFFGLHCVLWFARSLYERLRHGPHPKPTYAKGYAIQRFNKVDRVNHALVIVTFFGLAITGLPLLYADKGWAVFVANLFGGIHACGNLHRIFAVGLTINFIVHGVGVFRRFKKYGIKQMLFGPTTMLPTKKDLFDAIGMFKWFVVGGKKPKFDRWTYWEKFDYMAEVGGSVIIGVSGLILWKPVFFSTFLPGWMFNAATIVHGFEALLAVGFIFTIHFYNAHLRLEKFPVDDVMFTGRLPEEEFKHERGAEYDRMVATGEIERLKVTPPPAWYRHFAVAMGITAMVIGTTIVTLIILAALSII